MSNIANTFEAFLPRPGSEQALAAFRALAGGSAPPLLFCSGTTGNGKSYLVDALSVALYRRGIFARVIPAAGLIEQMRACMDDGHIPPYDEQLRRYASVQALLIDDLGAGSKLSEWECGVWETIVNHRWANQLLTVITSNLALSQLPTRIQSRFLDRQRAVVVVNRATDYRRER